MGFLTSSLVMMHVFTTAKNSTKFRPEYSRSMMLHPKKPAEFLNLYGTPAKHQFSRTKWEIAPSNMVR
jgi:hypothetical protein